MNTSRRRPPIGITERQLEAKIKGMFTKLKICPVHGRCKAHIFPKPYYDSGWIKLNPRQSKSLTHNVGGSTKNYFIDLTAKSTENSSYISIPHYYTYVSQYSRKGRYVTSIKSSMVGAEYQSLTSKKVKIYRQMDDCSYQVFRIRIWKYE